MTHTTLSKNRILSILSSGVLGVVLDPSETAARFKVISQQMLTALDPGLFPVSDPDENFALLRGLKGLHPSVLEFFVGRNSLTEYCVCLTQDVSVELLDGSSSVGKPESQASLAILNGTDVQGRKFKAYYRPDTLLLGAQVQITGGSLPRVFIVAANSYDHCNSRLLGIELSRGRCWLGDETNPMSTLEGQEVAVTASVADIAETAAKAILRRMLRVTPRRPVTVN